MNSYERDNHLRGVAFRCLARAGEAGLKWHLEAQTGLSFGTWLSDRKAAQVLEIATRDWIATYCVDCFKGFPFAAADMLPREVLMAATVEVFGETVSQHFGHDRAITLLNLVLQNLTIRDDFLDFLERGRPPSERDFSFLLDRLSPQD